MSQNVVWLALLLGLMVACGEPEPAPTSDAPLDRGLAWLARERPGDGVAEIAWSALAWQQAGHPDRDGARRLIREERHDQSFADDVRVHALAALALADTFWMTRDPGLKRPAQHAMNHLAATRNPYSGWGRRSRRPPVDTLTTAWALCAVKAGNHAALVVDPDALAGARAYAGRTDGETAAEQAAILVTRLFTGEDPGPVEVAERLARERTTDAEAIWWITLALFQLGGSDWQMWHRPLRARLAATQHPDGSWGDVRTTALHCMALATVRRYERMVR